MQAWHATKRIGFAVLMAAALALVLVSTITSRSADNDKGLVADLLSRLLSTPTARVSIGSITGALSSESTIGNIAVADRDGVWLKIDKIHLNWTRSALLFGRLEVDTLEIGTVTILRRPLATEPNAPVSDEPILPEIPLKVEVKDFKLGKLALGEGVIGVAATLSASGNASLGKPSKGLELRFEAHRLDAAGTVTAQLDLVPQTERLDLKLGVEEPAGGILAHLLNVPGQPPVKLDLNGSGTLDDFNARLAFTAGDDANANGTARLQREDQRRRLSLDLAARIEGLLPVMAAPVFAGTTRLTGIIDFANDGTITIAPLSVASQTARLDLKGTLSADQIADLKISAQTVPNAGLKTAMNGIEIGALAFNAHIAGPVTSPKIDATLDAADLATPQGKAMHVAGTFTVTPDGGLLDETTSIPFSAKAQVDGLATSNPVLARALGTSLSLSLAGRARDGIFELDTTRLKTATADVRFAGRIGETVLQGNLTAAVSDLARFDDRLSGQVTLAAMLSGTPARPDATASVTVTDARALGRPVPRLLLKTAATDVTGLIDARVKLTGTVDGKPAKGGLHLAKQADGGWRLDGLDLTVGSVTAQGDLRLTASHLATGRITIEAGDLDDLSPLVLTKLSGRMRAEAILLAATEQAGTWRLRVDRLVVPQTRNAGLPPLDIEASGRLAGERSTIHGKVGIADAGTIRVSGAVPLRTGGKLDLRADGDVDLGLANRVLSGAGRQITGRARLDVRATGSLSHPMVNGAATLANADYRDALLGIHYTEIAGRIAAQGTAIEIERVTAKTPNGGTITAQGRVQIEPAAGFPGDIKISARRAKLIENDIVSAVANLALSLSGPLARKPTISGKVDVVSLDVMVPERLPTTLSPIQGTVHVAPPPAAAARLEKRRTQKRASRAPPFHATLDLAISAPNRIFVRGRGIDAELGGSLQVHGPLSDPITVGAFELRRGRLSIAGTRLDFTRGRVAFTGNLTPTLDFVAQTRAEDVTAIVAVDGPARHPSFTFSSQPELPQDEVLSRLLFSKASGGLSPIQMLQLAQVAAQFSGAGGSGVFERVRKSLGVDSLDVSVGANGNPTVGVSRAINRRISVGVKTGTEPADSGASIDIDVTRNLRLKGEAVANGGAAVGVGMEWEY
jgi:autotransporter translocation and assembly factor TamB